MRLPTFPEMVNSAIRSVPRRSSVTPARAANSGHVIANTGREYCVLAECGAQHVHREVEQPAGARQILLRPEHRQGAVPGNWLRPGGHDQCQQRDAVTLRRWTAKGCVADAQTSAAKKLDCDRHLAANSQLIPGARSS